MDGRLPIFARWRSYDVQVTWEPGQRRARRELEAPYEDVPEHLRGVLQQWARGGFHGLNQLDSERLSRGGLELRITFQSDGSIARISQLSDRWRAEPSFLLDTIEHLLETYGDENGRASRLKDFLEQGFSAYRVSSSRGGLERYAPAGVREVIHSVASSEIGSAGDHLTEAWNAAFGWTPDPVKG